MADVSGTNRSPSPTDVSKLTERQFCLHLIKLYRESPELWNTNSEDYLNKYKRNVATHRILKVLRQIRPDFNEYQLKKKINILRTNFNKECRKLEQLKQTGKFGDSPPRSTLWYFNHLLFIKNPYGKTENKNYGTTKDEEGSETFIEETEHYVNHDLEESDSLMVLDGEDADSSAPDRHDTQSKYIQPSWSEEGSSSSHKAVKKKKRSFPHFVTKSVPNATEFVEIETPFLRNVDNEAEILAKGWTMKLSRLAPDQRLYAEKMINDILFEAEMGTLSWNGRSVVRSGSAKISGSPQPYSP